MKETVKDRLLKFIDIKNLSINKFEGLAGLSVGYMRQLRKEPSRAKIKSIILAFPELNESWLLTGEGEMLNNGSNARILGEVYVSSQGDDNVAMVDYIPGTATATFIEYVGDGNPELDKIAVLKQYGETFDKSYKVFEVIGESMSPRIPNRAKILTKEIHKAKWGTAEGVVVVVFGDEIVVKRIINNDLNSDNSLVLSSDNPKYGERRIALADIRAMYKAMRIISADIL